MSVTMATGQHFFSPPHCQRSVLQHTNTHTCTQRNTHNSANTLCLTVLMKGTGVSMCGFYTHTVHEYWWMPTGANRRLIRNTFQTHTYIHTHTHTLSASLVRSTGTYCQSSISKWIVNTSDNMAHFLLFLLNFSRSTLIQLVSILWLFSQPPYFFQVVELNKTICLCLRKISPYLIPFNEVASVPQRVRDGRRLEFQRVDPRLSTRHGFTHTLTLTFSLSHTCTD